MPDRLTSAWIVDHVGVFVGLHENLDDALGHQDVVHLVALRIFVFLLVKTGDVAA